jgi:chemotaxis protein methyltransferase CheR
MMLIEEWKMGAILTGILNLSEEDFEFFRGVIYKESGIRLSDIKRALVQARLMKRLRELKITDYHEYSEYLNENYDEEVVHLINCITTNKTDFFREPYHFEYIERTILPQLEREKKREIRIWSAGCSTGEEPYTILITLLEYYGNRTMPDIKFLATDIDTRVLDAAVRGIYSEDAVRIMPLEILRKYFLQSSERNKTVYMVKEMVRDLVHFRRLNLLDEELPMKRTFDIIFCRNVFIYFDNSSKRRVLGHFHRYLNNNGSLFMGHAETLSDAQGLFKIVQKSIYRKIC